jgi:TolA-binding protein
MIKIPPFLIILLLVLVLPEKGLSLEDTPVLKKLLVKDEEKKIMVLIEGSSELSPTIFRLSDPMRLVVDLAGVRPGPFKGKMTLRKDPVTEITTTHKGKPGELTRIEIFLTGPVEVSHTFKENQLTIELSKSLIEEGEWAKKEEVLEKPPQEEVKKEVVVRPEVIAKEKGVKTPDSRLKTKDRKEKVKVKGPVKPVHLRILIAGTLDEAKGILSEIKRGRPFAILARERSLDEKTKKEGGYIGKTDGRGLPSGISEAMAGLKEGEVSEPIPLEEGRYAIIQVITLRYYAEGMKAFRKGNFKEAELAFKRHLELNPDGTKSYLRLGEIYEDRGDFKGAEEMYRNAVSFDPSLEEAYIRLEALYLKTGEQEKAKEISEKRSSLERKGIRP